MVLFFPIGAMFITVKKGEENAFTAPMRLSNSSASEFVQGAEWRCCVAVVATADGELLHGRENKRIQYHQSVTYSLYFMR